MAELAALCRGPARAPGVEELAGEALVEVAVEAPVAIRAPVSEVEVAHGHVPHLGRLLASLMALVLHVTCLDMVVNIYNK